MFYCCQFIFALVSMKLLVNLQPYTKEAFQYWGGGGGVGGAKPERLRSIFVLGGGIAKATYTHACTHKCMHACRRMKRGAKCSYIHACMHTRAS